jgi:phosphoglycerol transferase MdoB-like AlkP superfamily enzyme
MEKRFCWQNFFAQIRGEVRLFCFFLALFILFRVAFIALMKDYMAAETGWPDILLANFYGLKLSLKSAGSFTAIAFILDLAAYFIKPSLARRVRFIYGALSTFLLTVLFCARFPYYAQFHSAYNQLIFNTFNDDAAALFYSLVAQFNLFGRLAAAFILAGILIFLLKRWLDMRLNFKYEPTGRGKYLARALWLVALYWGAVFVSFGGGMSFAANVDWENSGVTKDKFLNEAILDDVQALYRAYELNGRMESSTGLLYTEEDVWQYAKFLGKSDEKKENIGDYLMKQADGGREYQHIFLILSESYANWPLSEKYADLHIADGMKEIIARDNAAYADTVLPNGMSTISAVMGVVTGLADANLYLTTMPNAYESPYLTAIAPQMKNLGFAANFWYAGPPSWERIGDFTLAQGFEHFYGRGDYPSAAGSVWGCDDEYLYAAVLDGTKNEKTFSVVLNVSNHSPYTVDLEKAGCPLENIRKALKEKAADEELVKELGHHWYADRELKKFIDSAAAKFPDSLFIVVGDHADRVNVEKNPSMYERYAVPLIIYGAGINKNTLAQEAAGSQIDILPTLMEIAAPKGFEYYSVGASLTKKNTIGINYGFWLTKNFIGKTDTLSPEYEAVDGRGGDIAAYDLEKIKMQTDAVRCLSWHIGKQGAK